MTLAFDDTNVRRKNGVANGAAHMSEDFQRSPHQQIREAKSWIAGAVYAGGGMVFLLMMAWQIGLFNLDKRLSLLEGAVTRIEGHVSAQDVVIGRISENAVRITVILDGMERRVTGIEDRINVPVPVAAPAAPPPRRKAAAVRPAERPAGWLPSWQ